MIPAGEYTWKKNDRYGSNHRRLTLEPDKRGKPVRFKLVVTHSAGFQGSDYTVYTGKVASKAPDRLELIAQKAEHVTDDSDRWSEERPCNDRLQFVAVSKLAGLAVTYTLDDEEYLPVKAR